MFIRWKSKPRTKQTYGYDDQGRWVRQRSVTARLYSAYLAESKRVEGSVVQTAIYLTSIQDTQIRYSKRRAHFWQTIQQKFEALDLSNDLITKLYAKLEERVPRP